MNNFNKENLIVDLSKIVDFPIIKDKLIVKSHTKRNLMVNQYLILKNDFLRDLYLTVGDGSFHKGVYLSNINYRLHKSFIKTFSKYFNIKKDEFVISLTVNREFEQEQIDKSTLFWTKALNFAKINRFYLTNFNTFVCGDVKVIYDNIKLSILLKKIIGYTNNLVYKNILNKKQLCFILDGVLNAEGSASIDEKKWGLHKIVISFNHSNQQEKDLFFEILKNLNLDGIIKTNQKGKFIISKWYNHYLFIKLFVENDVIPFSLSPKRAIKLLWGFLNHQRTKSIYKYLKIINKKEGQTFKEINEFLNYHKSSLEEAFLRKFNQFNFFKVDNSKRPYKVSITEEGRFFLYLIRKLNPWLDKAEKLYFEDLKLLKEVGMKENLLPFERIQKEVFVRKESETNWAYGQDPEKRTVEKLISYGIINLNKPSGPTSHQVSDYVQKILGINKAGHSGTLAVKK